MAIKSVREISFFQTLGDRELDLSFLNSVPEKTNEEIANFTYYLAEIVKKEIAGAKNPQLAYMKIECINSLLKKLNPEEISSKEIIKLTVVEIIHLHDLLEYFENNYDIFRSYAKECNISQELDSFIAAPANYFSTIFHIKNNLEYTLGQCIIKEYKYK